MKISTELGSSSRFVGERRAVELIAKAGFDAWDFTMYINMIRYDWGTKKFIECDHPLAGKDYLAFARELKKIGEDNGITCNQSHAPFPIVFPEIRSYLERAIECTAEAGGKICIIHPYNDWSAEKNAEMYSELLPFAKDCKVKIATENMWNWNSDKDCAAPAACSDEKSFIEHLQAVDDDYLVACLDIGHAEMKGLGTSAVNMVRALGDKLQALHIHDNDRWHDSHQLPYTMDIDFTAIIRALKEINYDGYFTLESNAYIKSKEEMPDELKKMAETARKMADEFDSL